MQLNPEPLRIVPASKREFWDQLAEEVKIDAAGRFRKRWAKTETLRVILATPDETYEDVAKAIDRSPGAVRYRRMAMVHLLREEHGAHERVLAYEADPKENHKHHDYYEVHTTLGELGFYDRPAYQQIALAKELRQPSKSWRGDGTSAALAATDAQLRGFREQLEVLLREARAFRKANAHEPSADGPKANVTKGTKPRLAAQAQTKRRAPFR